MKAGVWEGRRTSAPDQSSVIWTTFPRRRWRSFEGRAGQGGPIRLITVGSHFLLSWCIRFFFSCMNESGKPVNQQSPQGFRLSVTFSCRKIVKKGRGKGGAFGTGLFSVFHFSDCLRTGVNSYFLGAFAFFLLRVSKQFSGPFCGVTLIVD